MFHVDQRFVGIREVARHCRVSFSVSLLSGILFLVTDQSHKCSVIIATGIMALVDDTIRRRWPDKGRMNHSKNQIWKSSLMQNIHLGPFDPKQLIQDFISRHKST